MPFELGRPLGAPDCPAFQREVLHSALKLLERDDGPVLMEFSETPHVTQGQPVEWSPPLKLSATGNLKDAVLQETMELEPCYIESVKKYRGRRMGELTGFKISKIVEFLADYLDDAVTAINPLPELPAPRSVKLFTDDLRHYYFQAALLNETGLTSLSLGNWYWGETRAGELTLLLRNYFINLEDPRLVLVGKLLLVPYNHYHRYLDTR